MKKEQISLIQKAKKSLDAAKELKALGYYDFAISRAYYSMFYLASAFLESQELNFSKHSAVIAAFGKHFAKTQIVNPKYHRYLIDAQKARSQADYNTSIEFSEAEVNDYLQQAEDFLSLIPILEHL
ncbi:HEPN domain-containing protein [Picosynechococcus sp. PCC 73109]|uniref:HEPN domain-containing protein n=1 Tax=Picosynechococcus sp. PCC 73109 TaxID=374982 RepID=UPI0007458D01|nr:HEPN domain-containing protein [Picosynechococcus sp. PCC 73109]AMA10090.1 DNA-binding protein [Picosynechococcus sp. PCC 73109]